MASKCLVSLFFPSLFPPDLAWRLLLSSAGASFQLLVGEIEIALVYVEVEAKFVLCGYQCLAKCQALLHHITVHLLRPGSHPTNHFHDWSLELLPTLC